MHKRHAVVMLARCCAALLLCRLAQARPCGCEPGRLPLLPCLGLWEQAWRRV